MILQFSGVKEISPVNSYALNIKPYISFTDPIQRIQSSLYQQTSPKYKAITMRQNRR
jgi:hypothetical protein